MDSSGMGKLAINFLKRHGAILFEGAVQLKLFPETKIRLFE